MHEWCASLTALASDQSTPPPEFPQTIELVMVTPAAL
jgi:hypothetical protein